MEKIQNARAADSRKKIFISSRKPDDFVGKDRSDNDDLIVVKQKPVNLHRHIDRETTIG